MYYVCMYICMFVFMYVGRYVYMYVCIHLYAPHFGRIFPNLQDYMNIFNL